MYGFEPLSGDEPGGFEQLVFNFASEKVQSVINEWTLASEQQEYALEGVEWTNLAAFSLDNHHVITLLERGSMGVFSALDEVCMSSHNFVMQPPHPPSSVTNSTGTEDESGTSTPSLLTVSPDDIFLEKLAEKLGAHPCLEVRPLGGGQDTTTGAEACSTPELKLPHHCFR